MTPYIQQPRPMRQARIFNLEEFLNDARPGMLGKLFKKLNKLSDHKHAKRISIPQRGQKIVKSSEVIVTEAQLPYS